MKLQNIKQNLTELKGENTVKEKQQKKKWCYRFGHMKQI